MYVRIIKVKIYKIKINKSKDYSFKKLLQKQQEKLYSSTRKQKITFTGLEIVREFLEDMRYISFVRTHFTQNGKNLNRDDNNNIRQSQI